MKSVIKYSRHITPSQQKLEFSINCKGKKEEGENEEEEERGQGERQWWGRRKKGEGKGWGRRRGVIILMIVEGNPKTFSYSM